MESPNPLLITKLLSRIPYLGCQNDLSSLLVKAPEIKLQGDAGVEIELVFSVPMATQAEQVAQALHAEFANISAVDIASNIPEKQSSAFGRRVSGVKNIIAVASGKGGVGKSTTSVNLALALAKEGAAVGILDADIYGPSQPHMLSVQGRRPEVRNENRIVPIDALGVQCISMGNLVTEKTPMVWRGPMASGALQQLLMNTDWDELDYLIIDMPPGTGDIPLTLSQKVPVDGALIVTTPQDIALLDAKKGIEMFNKVSIPVLGIVENMAVHVCGNCGQHEHIFGEGGGKALAEQYQVEVLASLPLDITIREETDAGRPPVVSDPESPVSLAYRQLARKVAAGIACQAISSGPEISVTDD